MFYFSGLNSSTTITGLTVLSQPQLVGQSQTISVGLTGKMDDSQPVDLAGVKKANLVPGVAPLKIPAVPQRPLPPRPTV